MTCGWTSPLQPSIHFPNHQIGTLFSHCPGIAFHAEVAIYCAFTLTQHWTAIPRGFTDERIYNSTHIFSLQA
jgi:hypothetical protein